MSGRKHEKPFICVDVDLPRNPRVVGLSEPAACLGLWTALTAYAREELTNGMVPKRYARALWGDQKNPKRLDEMVDVGLLADRGDQFEVLRYSPRNQTKDMVEDARAKARDRMRNVRANSRRTVDERSGDVLTSTSLSSDSEGEPERVSGTVPVAPAVDDLPPRRRANATDDGAMGGAVAAWAEGIRSVTGQPFVTPRGFSVELEKLVGAICEFCPDPAARVHWARLTGAEYARARAGEKLNAHAFLDWLNSGKPSRTNGKTDAAAPVYDGPTIREERRRREADRKKAEREAVPAPVADLLAAIGGGK